MAAPPGIVLPHARAWREHFWLTQGEWAAKANMRQSTVSRAEQGESVSMRTVRELARALGIAPERLRDEAPEKVEAGA